MWSVQATSAFARVNPRMNVFRSTHLCDRTSDGLKFEDSSLSTRADSLVTRANLSEFLETSLFPLLICLKLMLLIPNHIRTLEARIQGYLKDSRAILKAPHLSSSELEDLTKRIPSLESY